MVTVLFPFMSRMGGGFSWKDATILTWGGLRGAVGLALALDVDIQFAHKSARENNERDFELGSHVLFHVSGVAMLTLLVNGLTVGPLLKILGMTKTDKYHKGMHQAIAQRVHDQCLTVFDREVSALSLDDEQSKMAQEKIGKLSQIEDSSPSKVASDGQDSDVSRTVSPTGQGSFAKQENVVR